MRHLFATVRFFASAALIVSALGGTAQAQEWPTRAVTIVVPFGPGASNDLFARSLSAIFARKFGVPFVIDNRPGSGGFAGSDAVARAAPDGYTLLEQNNSVVSLAPMLKVDFDTMRDLTAIAMIAQSPNAMVVPASLPVTTVKEFIEYAKANPDKTFYGASGTGTQLMHAEQLNVLAGIKVKQIMYKTSAAAQTDLMAGRVQLMFATMASVAGQIQSNQLRLLAYTGPGAPPGSLKAPTMEEAGVKGFAGQIWWGLFGPPGMPASIRDKLHAATNEALADPDLVALLHRNGAVPYPLSQPAFRDAVAHETSSLDMIIKATNLKFE